MGKKRILIIDDEKDLTKIMKFNLEKTDLYEVRTESDGAQGIAAAKEFKPDLILLDIMMPGLDGGAVAQRLSSDEDTKKIPTVFLTAMVGKNEVKAGGSVISKNVFIAKPVDMEELNAAIEQWVL